MAILEAGRGCGNLAEWYRGQSTTQQITVSTIYVGLRFQLWSDLALLGRTDHAI
jgi:hypothetical protein